MSTIYIVNIDPREGESCEIHTTWCKNIPGEDQQLLLGHFDTCHEAIKRAHSLDLRPNGCAYCCRECKTA